MFLIYLMHEAAHNKNYFPTMKFFNLLLLFLLFMFSVAFLRAYCLCF